MHRKAEKET